jgi:hypothetical protein
VRTLLTHQFLLFVAGILASFNALASDAGRALTDDHLDEPSFWYVSSFGELRIGTRTNNDEFQKRTSVGEARLQVRAEGSNDVLSTVIAADFLYDTVADDHSPDLDSGTGFVDLREANVSFSPASAIDLKVGRQIITWGTGDLLFINDMFPKDFTSFFIGRDPEYLKAPSDALKLSAFINDTSVDIVYTPRFNADRFIDGSRLSYYNRDLGRIAGRDAIVSVDKPDELFDDDEIAFRLYRNTGGVELALYAYTGFWKSPAGSDSESKATFPALNAYGASAVGVVGKGIANVEVGYYDSRDDEEGDDPLVRNSELRFMLGYKQEIVRNLNFGIQYYLEHMIDHDEYIATLPVGAPASDENRQLYTLRLTQLLMNQDLELNLFTFYSPSDEDGYVKASSGYKIDDQWRIEAGANIFFGDEDHTEFGQLIDNSNIYVATRYSY